MIKELRERYNSEFEQDKFDTFLNDLNTRLKYPADFRVSETPLFLSDDLKNKLIEACSEILLSLQSDKFKERSVNAIPPGLSVPGEDSHPKFLQIDFAICSDSTGGYTPRLIELQGFPSLYCYQYFLNRCLKEHYPVLEDMTCYFSGVKEAEYIEMLKKIILGNSDPENVILLEIEPEKQKTRIDFAATEELLGVRPVCITKVKKKNKSLYYEYNGKEIKIERIYNRVIFDELHRKEIKTSFDFKDELDVTWVGHPNWFFRISKYSLPLLKSGYVPGCYFLNELNNYPDDLSRFVLKPLFSFAGLGVEIDLNKQMLDKIKDRENYILQEKITYAPLIKTPDDYSKVEIRMMFLWDEKPLLVNNLIRMSKGKMMGVDFNKNKTWVGSSAAYHK